MKIYLVMILLALACCSYSDTLALMGKDFAFQSVGVEGDSGRWEMKSGGYVGTIITLAKPGKIDLALRASGKNAKFHIHIDDKNFEQAIDDQRINIIKGSCELPAGTYWIRIELAGEKPGTDFGAFIDSLKITGDGIALRNVREDQTVFDAADTYIENHRKTLIDIAVADGKGKPLPAGTEVHVRLKRHGFNFGTAVYGTNQSNGGWLMDKPATDSDAFKYQDFLKSHFNMIVLENAGKWGCCEPEQGKPDMQFVDGILGFAKKNGIRARMHCTMWGMTLPKWAEEMLKTASSDSDQQKRSSAAGDFRKAITSRINYLVKDRADGYVELDGINESAHQDAFIKAYGENGVSGIYDEIIKASGGRARVYFNEYNLFQWNREFGYKDDYADWYADHINKIMSGMSPANRSKIGIGMQYYPHASADAMKYSPHNPVVIAQVLQNLSRFELPMSLTEFDVQEGGEKYAPKFLADTMRLVFGSQYTTTFMMWGFCKPHMWLKGGALVDEKWNVTDTGKVYEQMLGIKDWGLPGVPVWTTDLTLKTDSSGKVSFKGFYGEYEVTARGKTSLMNVGK